MFNYALDPSVVKEVLNFKKNKEGYNSPILVYSSYNPLSLNVSKYLTKWFPHIRQIDLFEYPAITMFLETRRDTALFFWKGENIKMLDIPAAIYREIDSQIDELEVCFKTL